MHLHLIRHAAAAAPTPDLADEARPLTRDGRRRFRRVARGLAKLDLRYDVLIHSPLLRAVETAELLADLAVESRVDDRLARPPSRQLLAWLATLEQEGHASVALVGHQPWFSELAAWLLTGTTDAASALPLKKGGVLWLEGRPLPGAMSLRAALSPSILRALG